MQHRKVCHREGYADIHIIRLVVNHSPHIVLKSSFKVLTLKRIGRVTFHGVEIGYNNRGLIRAPLLATVCDFVVTSFFLLQLESNPKILIHFKLHPPDFVLHPSSIGTIFNECCRQLLEHLT